MNSDEFGSDMGGDVSNDVDNDTDSEGQAFSEMGVEAMSESPDETNSDIAETFESDLATDPISDVDNEAVLAVENSTEIDNEELGEIDSELLADVGIKDVEDDESNYDDVKAALEEYDYDTSDYGRGSNSFNAKSVAELTGTSSSEAAETMHAARDDAVKAGEFTRGEGPGEEHPSPEEVEAYPLDSLKDLAYQQDEMVDQDDDTGE